MVLAVIGIGGRIRPFLDRLDIAVGIVGIGIGGIVPRCRIFQRGYLSAGLSGRRRPVGNGICQNRGAAVLGYPFFLF